jgi:hypothetical protein
MDPLGNVIVDDRLATSCGKLMLLNRMLEVLKKGGHKVMSLPARAIVRETVV